MLNTCVRCGKQFEANVKTAVCQDCHTAVCVVCGKEFVLKYPYTAKTCCSKCRGEYRKISGIGKQVAAKAAKTVKERYGVTNAGNLELKPRKCEYCGKMFVPQSNRQKFCKDDHYGPCPVCGKLTKILDMTIGPQACSEECRVERIKQTCEERYGNVCVLNSEYGQEKRKETCEEKYGVDHYSKTAEFRNKYTSTMKARYGVSYPLQSDEFRQKAVQTSLERYGTEYPIQNSKILAKIRESVISTYGGYTLQSEELRAKMEATMRQKYGVANAQQSTVLHSKSIQTNLERYGVENPLQSEEIRQKVKETNLNRYGVEYVSQLDEVKQKVRETSLEHYGVENPFQSSEIKAKIQSTNIERYGVPNPQQNKDIKRRTRLTNLQRYGAESWLQSDARLKLFMTDSSKLDQFKEFQSDVASYILSHFDERPSLKQIAESTGVDVSTISLYVITADCQQLVAYHVSSMEQEVYDFLLSLDPSLNIVKHERKQIAPKEIDIYLPDYSFGIECNPTYTHNSSVSTCWSDEVVPMTYHRDKSFACMDKHIQLLHVFGYQWTYHKEIIKSMICNVLHKNKYKYYARKLAINEVSYEESVRFLNENHLQGSTNASIRYGLYDNSNLISVMTFNKMRGTMGQSNSTTNETYELSRFCTKLYTTCVGSASKLLNYFMQNVESDKLISFSDVAVVSGNVYSILGFQFDYITAPNYVWVNSNTDLAYNRVACQKNKLRKLFNDNSIDIEHSTESEIMESHGFVKVYNSGLIKWVLNRNEVI